MVDVQVDNVLVYCLNQLAWCAKGTNNKAELRLTFRTAVSHRHKINDLWSDENSLFFTSSDFRITRVCFCSKRWSPHGFRGSRTVSAHFGSPRYESSFDADLSLCPSKSLSCCTAFSSRVSTTYSTSKTLLVYRLRDRRGRHDDEAFESDAVNVGLIFLRATNGLLPTDLLVVRLRRLELQLLRHRSSVGGVLTESSFQTFAKLFIELPVIIPVQLVPTRQGTFFHKVLPHHAPEFVLSKCLPREVQRKTLWIDPDYQEIQRLWNELVTLSQRELSTDVQLDIGVLFWFPAHRCGKVAAAHNRDGASRGTNMKIWHSLCSPAKKGCTHR